MNQKINKEQHEYLLQFMTNKYVFGSQLHGTATEKSDTDYVCVVPNDVFKLGGIADYLPNIHSLQYTDAESSTDYIWVSESQFYRNLFSGDGNIYADIVIFSGEFTNPLNLVFCFKIIKGYLGVARRDLKLHPNSEKKRHHAHRSIHTAMCLMNKLLPTVEDFREIYTQPPLNANILLNIHDDLRNTLTNTLNRHQITLYPKLNIESDDPVGFKRILIDSNNLTEFKY